MMNSEHPPRSSSKNSWDSFKPIGDETRDHQHKGRISTWISLTILLAVITITIIPLLCMICLAVATRGHLFAVNPTTRVFPDKIPIFGDRYSFLLFTFALGVWWLTNYLAQPVLVAYGPNLALLARFAMGCIAYAPAVWLMLHQLDRRERAEENERQAIQEAKRRQAASLNRGDDME